MKTEMIRRNQKLFDQAYDSLSMASCDLVAGVSSMENNEAAKISLELHLMDLDSAIAWATKGLSALYQLRGIRDAAITVNLSESTNGMVESDTPLLDAGESPVIRSLPETEQIKPLLRMPTSSHAVPLEI